MAEATYQPRRELGQLLRSILRCPMRHGGMEAMLGMDSPDRKPLRVVAYRPKSIRLECQECGLRFSVDPANLADSVAARETPTPAAVEAMARKDSASDPTEYLSRLTHYQGQAARFEAEQRSKVLEPHQRALAQEKPRKGQIRFPKR